MFLEINPDNNSEDTQTFDNTSEDSDNSDNSNDSS